VTVVGENVNKIMFTSLSKEMEVTTDTPVLSQFESEGQFVIQTAWIS